ncbi:MAG: IS110 family transposase [Flavobacteriaceae bacterium]|nr:IS110 family transposase [Flavobacteriaceae bacterium]
MSKDKKKRASKKGVEYLKYSVGIDISKDKIDVNISVIDITQSVKVLASRQFKNTKGGHKLYGEWVKRKCKLDLLAVHTMEATGIYYEKLAWYLHREGEYLSVVLPNKAKKYLQSLGFKSKNDKIDAKGLARMGAEQRLDRWKAPSEKIMRLRNITRHREQLAITKTQINNQLHALKYGEYANEELIKQQEEVLLILNTQIKETAAMIKKIVNQDSELKRKIENITEINGVGLISVATVIAETNAFEYFTNKRQLVSYCGYDVIENQSGKHVGKTKISKRGNTHIRRILHLPAFSVVSGNELIFKNLYERVYKNTKHKMKGYVAVQRKLLLMIFTLWKKNEKYDREQYLVPV